MYSGRLRLFRLCRRRVALTVTESAAISVTIVHQLQRWVFMDKVVGCILYRPDCIVAQDERWMARCDDVLAFFNASAGIR